MTPLLTCVVPCWGTYSQHLDECLSSIPRGTQIVVVGDSTAARIASMHGARFVPLPLDRQHIALARELGRDACDTPQICFVDADDILLTKATETLSRVLQQHPHAVAATGYLQRMAGDTRWPSRWLALLSSLPGGGLLQLFRNSIPATDACVIRCEALHGRVLFPSLADEDWHAALTLRVAGHVVTTQLRAALYRNRPGTLSRRPRDDHELAASHNLLVATALSAGARPAILWRLCDVLARRTRHRRRRTLMRQWP